MYTIWIQCNISHTAYKKISLMMPMHTSTGIQLMFAHASYLLLHQECSATPSVFNFLLVLWQCHRCWHLHKQGYLPWEPLHLLPYHWEWTWNRCGRGMTSVVRGSWAVAVIVSKTVVGHQLYRGHLLCSHRWLPIKVCCTIKETFRTLLFNL